MWILIYLWIGLEIDYERSNGEEKHVIGSEELGHIIRIFEFWILDFGF